MNGFLDFLGYMIIGGAGLLIVLVILRLIEFALKGA